LTAHEHEILWRTGLTLLLPLTSFVLTLFIPVRYSWTAPLLSTALLFFSVISSLMLFALAWNTGYHSFQFDWIDLGSTTIPVNIVLDNPSVVMVLMVSVVSFLVHLFSIGYMAGESRIRHYFSMLGFFTFSMLGIVIAQNLLILFVFWEFVGFSSYLLIGFYHERPEAASASVKAFLMNRTGDVVFLGGLLWLWSRTGSLDLDVLQNQMAVLTPGEITAIGLCIFCGAMAKSALFPFYTWLPDAMEGPTPVSALIHAATMVAAGVFLVFRTYFLFSPIALLSISVIGAITSILGAYSTLVHADIKKILAYSTVSQLGLMILCLGAGDPAASQLHLFAHAFFKSCLFLAAGALVHRLSQRQEKIDFQDIRNLGGLSRREPVLFFIFLVASASMAGIPFFAGFISKEAMLSSIKDPVLLAIGWIASAMTIAYSARLVWMIFLRKMPRDLAWYQSPIPIIMRIPIILLATFSLWPLLALRPWSADGWLYNGISNYPIHSSILESSLSAVVILLVLGGVLLLFRNQKLLSPEGPSRFVQGNLGLDQVIKTVVVAPSLALSDRVADVEIFILNGSVHLVAYVQITTAHLVSWVDKYLIDGVVLNFVKLIGVVGQALRSLSNGKIQSYIFWAAAGLVIFIVWSLSNK
jgi:NADH-quinone oxidoreductase subunit L